MYSYHLFPDLNLMVAKFFKVVTKDEILAYYEVTYNDPLYKQNFCGVVDLRNAELQITPDDIKDLAAIGGSNTVGKWALLVDNPMTTAFSLIYSDIVNKSHPLVVVSEVATASDYLGIDVEPYLA